MTHGATTIEYELVRTARQSIALQVHPDGRVVVRAPKRTPLKQIEAVVAARIAWIARHQVRFQQRAAAQPAARQFVDGAVFPYLGQGYRLRIVLGTARVQLDGDALVVGTRTPDDQARIAAQIERWYRTEAARVFAERLDAGFERIAAWGVPRPPLRIRDMKSRWGSCSAPTGERPARITLNLRLIELPVALLDYVVLHELCHLREMNHSKAFWALMDAVLPDWRNHRKALRQRAPHSID